MTLRKKRVFETAIDDHARFDHDVDGHTVLAEYGGDPASRAMTNAGHHRNSARTDLVHCPSIFTFIADLKSPNKR